MRKFDFKKSCWFVFLTSIKILITHFDFNGWVHSVMGGSDTIEESQPACLPGVRHIDVLWNTFQISKPLWCENTSLRCPESFRLCRSFPVWKTARMFVWKTPANHLSHTKYKIAFLTAPSHSVLFLFFGFQHLFSSPFIFLHSRRQPENMGLWNWCFSSLWAEHPPLIFSLQLKFSLSIVSCLT